jgi:hypothetical protein
MLAQKIALATDELSARAVAVCLLTSRHLLERPVELTACIGFRQKASPVGQVAFNDLESAGRDDDLDRRPPAAYGLSELQTVHGSGHIDIGEYDGDVQAAFEQPNCFIGVTGFQNVEAEFLHHVDCIHANERFVLDDEDDGLPGRICHFVRPLVRNRRSPDAARSEQHLGLQAGRRVRI